MKNKNLVAFVLAVIVIIFVFIGASEMIPIAGEKESKSRVFNEMQNKSNDAIRGIVGINIAGSFTLLGHYKAGYMIPYNIVKNSITVWKNQH